MFFIGSYVFEVANQHCDNSFHLMLISFDSQIKGCSTQVIRLEIT